MRTLLLRTLAGAFALLLGLIAILLVRTWQVGQQADGAMPEGPISMALDTLALVQRLAGALAFPTIAHQEPTQLDSGAFRAFQAYLQHQFPHVHSRLRREVVGGLSLLYTWPGQDTAIPAVLFLGHQDVVPAPDPEAWTYPPFAGTVAEGYVWGRGALDDKLGVLGILEAAESLLQEGFQPVRTIYLAFGHDEEVGGWQGARQISQRLATRRVVLIAVLDEGGFIVEDMIPGVRQPVALVGVAEKGYLSLELTATAVGGHASTPPSQTAIGVLSHALVRLTENPFPIQLAGPTRRLLEYIAPYTSWDMRLVLANLWLFGPVVARQLARSPAGNASLRTTAAPTIIEAGVKENVLPTTARAVVNFRIYPGETVTSVTLRVRQLLADLPVTVAQTESGAFDPSPVSPTESEAFQRVAQSIRRVHAESPLIVAPYLVPGATDARYFASLSPNVYRFIGVHLTPELLATVHGVDERVPVDAYVQAFRTYYALMRALSGP
jgi:carboxypeptidase PM20D1